MDGYVFPGRHTNVQYVHEMRLNITNSQGNANQNCNQISLHTGQNDHHQPKSLQVIYAEEGVQKREFSYIVGRNVKWLNH